MAAGTHSAVGKRLRGAAVLCAFCASALLAGEAFGAPQQQDGKRSRVIAVGPTRAKAPPGPLAEVPGHFDRQVKLAESGDAVAMYHVGLCYLHGKDGIPKDEVKAFHWFRRSAEAGGASGMMCLGTAYQFGQGVEADGGQAVRWYTRSFEAGCSGSASHLGLLYLHGAKGVEKDPDKAVRWFARAADAGESSGATSLARMYLGGVDVRRDPVAAEKWVLRAAELSGRQFRDDGSRIYLYFHRVCANGEYPVKKDLVEALKWARRAADAGNPEGMTLVGLAYFKGEGIDKDRAEAAKWFRMAADRNDVTAMRGLAFLYREGDGVARNPDEARRWENRAAAAQRAAEAGGKGSVTVSPAGPVAR